MTGKRRGQGEGSIRERPSGRWEARYRGSDGKPRKHLHGDAPRGRRTAEGCPDAARAGHTTIGQPADGRRLSE